MFSKASNNDPPISSLHHQQPANALHIISLLTEKAAAVEECQRRAVSCPNLVALMTNDSTSNNNNTSKMIHSLISNIPEDSIDTLDYESDTSSSTDWNDDDSEDDTSDGTLHNLPDSNENISPLPQPSVLQINQFRFQVKHPMSLEEIVACLHLATSKSEII